MLEIRDIHVLRDGRSVIDTRGRRRFRVLERRIRDGYNVASVEFLKDVAVPLEQREGDYQQNNLNYYCIFIPKFCPTRQSCWFLPRVF